MAVTKFTQEIKAQVSAKRMYKATATDAHTVLPKWVPNVVKSIHFLKGDGGAGSLRQTNFANGISIKETIEDLDIQNHVVKYTLIEGPMLGDKIEKVHFDQKIEDTSDGGCLITMVGEYHTKGPAQLTEEDIKASKDEALGVAKQIEEALLAHPEVCA